MTFSIPADVVEGLELLSQMCSEHLALRAEVDAAKQLLAPKRPEEWPTFEQETLEAALRNVLQVKLSAEGIAKDYERILDEVASVIGVAPGEWSRDEFLSALRDFKSSVTVNNNVTVLETAGPPYEYQEWRFAAKGVPWRLGGVSFGSLGVTLGVAGGGGGGGCAGGGSYVGTYTPPALTAFNDLQADGWEAVAYYDEFILLRRSVKR